MSTNSSTHFADYKVGDKVKIVSRWKPGCHKNTEGAMDKWLGKTMTIRKIVDDGILGSVYFHMEEDIGENNGDGWFWFLPAIQGLATECSSNVQNTVYITDTIHLGGTTYNIVDKFKKLISTGIINIEKLRLATVNYVVQENTIENGPVRLYFEDGTAVYLNLTAGYSGSGPTATCEILSLCNLNGFNKNDVLNHQSHVNVRYTKSTPIQIKDYDGNDI